MYIPEVLNAESYLSLFKPFDPFPDTKRLLREQAVEGVPPILPYKPQSLLISDETGQEAMEMVSFMGRMCWDKDWKKDPTGFIQHLIKMGHTSVLEHAQVVFIHLTGRDTSHEFVRHRIMSPTQQSQRYIRYSDPSESVPIVLSYNQNSEQEYFYVDSALMALDQYRIGTNLMGEKPEDARLVLPNQMGTIYGTSFNVRSLRNFLTLRMGKGANHRIRAVANDMLDQLESAGYGAFFSDLNPLRAFDPRSPYSEWSGLYEREIGEPVVICPADSKICLPTAEVKCPIEDRTDCPRN